MRKGMWKCHHCSWSKRIDISWNVPFGNLKEYDDLLMKTMIQHGPCYFCEIKGQSVDAKIYKTHVNSFDQRCCLTF